MHNFFVNTLYASAMNVSCPLGIYTECSKCLPATATQNPSLFRNYRVALSVNSCGKSFHIEARQSSARQCWLVLEYIVSPIAPHMIIHRTEIWQLKYQRGYF